MGLHPECMKKIAILCGGPSSEYDVSLNSAKTIFTFLNKKKYEAVVCHISHNLTAKILYSDTLDFKSIESATPLSTVLKKLKEDGFFAFLAAMHGEFGEDGTLQKLLEKEKISYSGSNVVSSRLCTDKTKSMSIVKSLGFRIPKTIIISRKQQNIEIQDFSYPIIVKPNNLGSSVGVFIVHNIKELHQKIRELQKSEHITQILIQEFINGIELSCGTLQDKNGKFILLPPIEIHPVKNELFDYNAKYTVGGSKEITPPVSIDKKLSDSISEATKKIHLALCCRTYSRSDFIVENGVFYYLETNTLPGMTATSLLPQEAEAIGISFPQLLDFLIDNS